MRTKFILAAGLIFGVCAAQTPPEPEGVTLKGLPRRFVADEISIWTSPFRSSSYSSHTVKKYLVPFTLISAGLIASDQQTTHWMPNSEDQIKWSGRVSQLGSAYSLGGFAGGTYLVGLVAKNDHARETGLLALEALGHAQVVVFSLKQITNRSRPPETPAGTGFWQGGNSFPSGHAISVFSVATVFAYEYRHHIAVPITAYGLAGIISVSRLSARRHWMSDIFVGGSAGFLIGRFVYKRHHNSALPGSPVKRTAKLIPQVGFGMGGPQLSWVW